MSWNEDSLHRWLLRQSAPRGLATGRGNDAAILSRAVLRPVVCVDQTIEGVHYDNSTPPRSAGRKACARALSDLAASGAKPHVVLLALSAPRRTHESRLRALISGVRAEALRYGAELAGGDTSCAEGPLAMSVTAIGDAHGCARLVARDRARPGQVVVATGPFGGSRAGRHLRIEPRFEAGRWLIALGATAMMDVSDGLALDLWRLARASEVAIDVGFVPIHRDAIRQARTSSRTPLQHALFDGEDHELVATLPAKAAAKAVARARLRFPGFAILGNVRRGSGLRVPRDESSDALVAFDGRGGWIHGV